MSNEILIAHRSTTSIDAAYIELETTPLDGIVEFGQVRTGITLIALCC